MGRLFSARKRQDILDKLEAGAKNGVIISKTGVSARQIQKMRRNWKQYGKVAGPQLPPSCPQKLNTLHQTKLLVYLGQQPTAYLDEICWFLYDEFDLVVSEATVSRALKKLL